MVLQVLTRSPKAAATIVQDGALPALAMVAGEGLSERAQVNATKVSCSVNLCTQETNLYMYFCCYAKVPVPPQDCSQSLLSSCGVANLVCTFDLQAIHRLAAMPSVEAMVRSSAAGRFLDEQASC